MKYYGMSDKGKLRKTNQDSYVIATNLAGDLFALVCDGIGGNLGGDVASRMAVKYFSVAFSNTKGFKSVAGVKKFLRDGVQEINRQIFETGKENPKLHGMGTTLCGVVISKVGKFVVNVGDSRCYSFRHTGEFQQLTMDHTLVNDMLMHGELTPDQAKNYPKKNVLTNAVGVWETVRCDIDTHMEDVDGFLLCSDGLHSYVEESTIRNIVLNTEMDPSLRARKLVKEALDVGGFDNVTTILIDLEDVSR